MTLSKSILGVAAAAALLASACERHNLGEVRAEHRGRSIQQSDAKPLVEPRLTDIEPSADGVSPAEAAGLSVASKALGEPRSAQRDIQLACTAAQDALNQATFASGVEWADAKLRAEQALRSAYQAVSATTEELESEQTLPEVKGATPAPRGRKEEER
jgi:hypothetical protein